MLLQQAVDYILGNIGGRYEGTLGKGTSEQAALQEINLAVKEISKFQDLPEWEYIHDFNLPAGGASFALPVISGQRTRALTALLYREPSATSWYTMEFLHHEEFHKRLYPGIDNTTSPFPQYYTLFSNTVSFFPKLSQELSFKAFLGLYPPVFDGTHLSLPLAFDPDWDTCVIAYATYKLFLRMQQMEDYQFWFREYDQCKKAALHAIRKRRMEPNHKADNRLPTVSDPARDPFIRSWR
jgi:hypothetical protein